MSTALRVLYKNLKRFQGLWASPRGEMAKCPQLRLTSGQMDVRCSYGQQPVPSWGHTVNGAPFICLYGASPFVSKAGLAKNETMKYLVLWKSRKESKVTSLF